MLEADLLPPDGHDISMRQDSTETLSAQYRRETGPGYITFEDFRRNYWREFSSQHPSLVYGQFIGPPPFLDILPGSN